MQLRGAIGPSEVEFFSLEIKLGSQRAQEIRWQSRPQGDPTDPYGPLNQARQVVAAARTFL